MPAVQAAPPPIRNSLAGSRSRRERRDHARTDPKQRQPAARTARPHDAVAAIEVPGAGRAFPSSFCKVLHVNGLHVRYSVVTSKEPAFRAFSNFGVEDMPSEAAISRGMLRRHEDIDNATTAGPGIRVARAAPASSVVAHAVVEPEAQLIDLKRKLARHI